jgi:hypothetical protein
MRRAPAGAHRRRRRVALQQQPDSGVIEPVAEDPLDRWAGVQQHVA